MNKNIELAVQHIRNREKVAADDFRQIIDNLSPSQKESFIRGVAKIISEDSALVNYALVYKIKSVIEQGLMPADKFISLVEGINV